MCYPLQHDIAKLRQEAATLVGLGGPCPHETLAHTVERQHHLLLIRLDRYKAHVGPAHRLADRLRVGSIIFVRLRVRFNELRCHQLYGIPHRGQLARPVMRAAARPMPIEHGGRLIKYSVIFARPSFLRSTALPRASTP